MTDSTAFTILTAARILDGSGGPPLEDAAVLVEGSAISAIGRRDEIRAPDGATATTHDYGDATILPGLVDGHTHLVGIGDGTRGDDAAAQGDDLLLLRAGAHARVILHSGVTTIRENGSMRGVAFSVREAIRRGIIEGPRMVVAGRAVTITGGHLHYFGGEADGVDGVRQAVRQLLKEGADFIKIMSSGGSTPNVAPVPAGVHARGTRRDGRRGASRGSPDRGPFRAERGDRGLPGRRRGHDHPRHHVRSGRDLPLSAGPRGPNGVGGRLGQPDDARPARLDRGISTDERAAGRTISAEDAALEPSCADATTRRSTPSAGSMTPASSSWPGPTPPGAASAPVRAGWRSRP